MNKRTKKILTVIVLIVLLNPTMYIVVYEFCRKEWLWLTYKNDIWEYVYNSEKNDVFDDPAICCMLNAVEEFDRRTDDSLKMDSFLVELLSFRDKKGEIQCNTIHEVAMIHTRDTRRLHMLPYLEALRDSFASYPEDMHYYTQNSDGVRVPNENIKKNIDLYIEWINNELKK